MRVFVTGASGFVGSAVTRQLIDAGHRVTGLARSDKAAAIVEKAGATALRGDLNDLQSLIEGATAADAVVHCGFIHDFSNFAASVATDKRAIETIGAVLAGSDRPLIVTAGTAGLAFGRLSTEEDAPNPGAYEGTPRVSEQTALAFRAEGLRASAMRLPPSVHGDGDHGFIPFLIGVAREKGLSGYVEAGTNVWPAVHREDAARAYVLAIESGAAYPRYHAVGEEGIPFRDIAAVIARKLDVPLVSIPKSDAAAHFGWMAGFAAMDVPASSRLTTERLGWRPTGRGLIEDLEEGTYFIG